MVDFSALHLALGAVRAARTGLDVTSNNVANSSTPGYTRQRVTLASSFSRQVPGGLVGTGVTIADIGRVRDQMADVRFRSGASTLAGLEIRSELLGTAEIVLGEPDHGVSAALSSLWDAFDGLSLSPNDAATRATTFSALENTAASIRELSSGLTNLESVSRDSLIDLVAGVNERLADVANLNDAIVASSIPPNDLLDKRDVILDELSSMLGTNVIAQDDGAVRVTLNGIGLVSDVQHETLSVDPSTGDITTSSGLVLSPGGEASGLQEFMTNDIPTFRGALDAMAIDLHDALNATNAAGFSPLGPGGDLLTYNAANPSGTLTVAITDPDEIATAATAGPPFPELDATNAEALAALRTSLSASGGTQTLESAFREIVTEIGARSAAIQASADSADHLQTAVSADRESVHGVSLDEEMVALMEYQRMYEAASRVITAVDQALDVLVNRTGVVGR